MARKPKETTNDEKLKLLFSSLFARKMNYAVFRKGGGSILFTNISMDEALLYEPNVEQYIHSVTIKDEAFSEWLYNEFPLLKDSNCLLDVRAFMTGVNKIKNGEIMLLEDSGTISLIGDEQQYECGTTVTDDTVNIYWSIFTGMNSGFEWKTFRQMDPSEVTGNLTVMDVRLNDSDGMISNTFKVYMSQGNDLPHMGEFAKKYKEPIYLELVTCTNNKAIKVKYQMMSDFVDVESVCPAMYWFPNLIPTKPKNKE